MSNEKFGVRHGDGEVTGRFDSWLEAYYSLPRDSDGTVAVDDAIVRLSEESGS